MSYYENSQWQSSGGSQSGSTWDHQTPPARSGASSVAPREDSTAFSSQLEEVDRAIENLFKSGKGFNNAPGRRESMPMAAGQGRGSFQEFDARMGGGPSRHHSVSEFGDARSYTGSNLQNFYANQRQGPPRASEAEQVMQAKRRMAAQRERELRNYHQEQQYNRNALADLSAFPGGAKPSDRTMSPGTGMSEDERRELIARQRSALYGEGAFSENGTPFDDSSRPATQGSAGRGPSPLVGAPGSAPDAGAGQSRSRANSTSSPSSGQGQAGNFSVFEAQQSSRASTSSPGGSPPRAGKPTTAPIGTRPSGNQAANANLTKQRSTTPLPSPLSYGVSSVEDIKAEKTNGDRSTSASSNPSTTPEVGGLGQGWGGNKNAVWGVPSKNSLGMSASVWG